MRLRKSRVKIVAALACGLAVCGNAIGQSPAASAGRDFPNRPIRIIVPFSAGSGPDVLSRMMGQKFYEAWGQPTIVDNRTGAAGIIATELVAKASPDGYTLLMSSPSQVITVALYPKLPYDFLRDITPVTLIAGSHYLLAINSQLAPRTLRDLVAFAKAKPAQLSYGSAGTGTLPHLAGEQLKQQAGVNVIHVPYKGAPQVINDVIGGQISMMFNSVATLSPFVKTGKLRGIAIAAPARTPVLPDLPTFAEEGMTGFEVRVWFGLLTTAGAPPATIGKLNAEVVRVLNTPDMRDRLNGLGLEVVGSTPQAFGELIRQDIALYARLIKSAKISLE
jgi:tripartite-type tricarboxylate transporter receptor subunit TctC